MKKLIAIFIYFIVFILSLCFLLDVSQDYLKADFIEQANLKLKYQLAHIFLLIVIIVGICYSTIDTVKKGTNKEEQSTFED